MKKQIYSLFSAVPVLLLVAYLLTAALNGPETALVMRIPDAENCLPVLLSLQIEADYEPEAVKAQAIIARSNLYRQIEEKGLFTVLGETGRKVSSSFVPFYFSISMKDWECYEEAVTETENMVLSYENELRLVPYHEMSSGTTRDGAEVLHSEEYSYLKSVDSSADKSAPDYLSTSYVAARQMPKRLVIKSRDSAGYVTRLTADGASLEGEAFRQGMNLASSNFKVQIIGTRYRFLCKGKGHGLGFSQYGGNAMAESGADCEEILKTYFPVMELVDVHNMMPRSAEQSVTS